MDLRRERERRKVSIPELAAAAEVSAATVYRLEAGVTRPQARTERRLLDALRSLPLRDDPGGDVEELLRWPAVLIRNLAWQRFDAHDGREIGGPLVGRHLGDRIVIESVYEDERAVRSRTSIAHDLQDLLAYERDAVRTGVRLLGTWHGHPAGSSPQASAQDKATWADIAATLRRTWVGIVVCESSSRGTAPLEVFAYLTRSDGECQWVSPVRI